jgi:excinuclease UvrABC helicase subunit UvrB
MDSKEDLEKLPRARRIEMLTKQMERAVKELRFEHALYLREQILKLKKEATQAL